MCVCVSKSTNDVVNLRMNKQKQILLKVNPKKDKKIKRQVYFLYIIVATHRHT